MDNPEIGLAGKLSATNLPPVMPATIRTPRQGLLIERIVEARKRAGMTQAELASKFNRHQPFIANIESGQRRLDLIELIEIAEVIGLDVHLIIDELKRLPAARPE